MIQTYKQCVILFFIGDASLASEMALPVHWKSTVLCCIGKSSLFFFLLSCQILNFLEVG